MRLVKTLVIVADAVYYPLEHITWLYEKRIIRWSFLKRFDLDGIGTVLWIISLVSGITLNIRRLRKLHSNQEGPVDRLEQQETVLELIKVCFLCCVPGTPPCFMARLCVPGEGSLSLTLCAGTLL